MAYFGKKRRLGADSVLSADLVTAPTTLSGWFSDPLGALGDTINDLENLVYSSSTGNLSSSAYQTIVNNGNQAIAAAAPDNPDLVAQEQAQFQAELQNVAKSSYYGGAGNLYADLGVSQSSPGAPAVGTQGLTGIAESVFEWVEANAVIVFVAAAAFLYFRPDKALRR